jgi:hypothetical protein
VTDRVAQSILWPASLGHRNQLLLISSTSSPVRLGKLDIVLSASEYLFSLSNCFVTAPACHFRTTYDALDNPADWPRSRTYTYSTTTSNTGLRGHLDKFHKEEYLKLAEERGWTTVLPSVKLALAAMALAAPVTKKPMFSTEAVTRLLVRFIAANDQVSFSHLSLAILIILLRLVFKCRRER